MEGLFDRDLWLIWALLLALALFFPVRNLIWVLQVRRIERKERRPTETAERDRLKQRAAVTAGLLCLLFAIAYTRYLFSGET